MRPVANCTAGVATASELFINLVHNYLLIVYSIMPAGIDDSYKVGIDVEMIANLS